MKKSLALFVMCYEGNIKLNEVNMALLLLLKINVLQKSQTQLIISEHVIASDYLILHVVQFCVVAVLC